MSLVRSRSALSTRLRATASVAAVALVAAPLSTLLPTSVAAAAETPPLSVKVDFAPAASAAAAGYAKDSGAAYDAAAGSGWVREDSLQGTHVPFAVPLNTRDRSACTAISQQARTFIHMQAPVTNATNDATKVAWEYALPNGTYQVSVGVGDPNTGADAETHTVNVEGVTAVKAFPRSTAASCTPSRLTTGTVVAQVTDGRLTVDALGGTNTKLAVRHHRRVTGRRHRAQGHPHRHRHRPGLGGGRGGHRLPGLPQLQPRRWPPPARRSPPRRPRTTPTPPPSRAPSTTTRCRPSPAAPPRPRPSPAPSWTTPPPSPPRSRRGTASATRRARCRPATPRDFGQNFTNTRGYGWVVPGSSDPLNLVSNGRTRTGADVTGLDATLTGLMHMQYPATGTTGIAQPGSWELAVPNGSYDVALSVGDADRRRRPHVPRARPSRASRPSTTSPSRHDHDRRRALQGRDAVRRLGHRRAS